MQETKERDTNKAEYVAKILIVDDHATNREFLVSLLKYRGHKTFEADTGVSALKSVESAIPDLVITDILMPQMDGYEFVKRLREMKGIEQPEVIFYSAAYLEEEAKVLAKGCGAVRVLAKPSDPEKLLQVVDETLAIKAGKQKSNELPRAKEDETDHAAVKVVSAKLFEKVRELEQLNDELDRRVARRTAELETLNRSLLEEIARRRAAEMAEAQAKEEQLQTKSQFLSHVSHELRSPLGVVYQFTTILLDEIGGPLTAEQREYLDITLRNVKQLRGMIDDLLEASRAEVKKLSLRRSSMAVDECVREFLKTYQGAEGRAANVAGRLTGEPLPKVYADPQRITQILTNLVNNAQKFSPSGTEISIHAQVYEHDPELICVSVADRGPGVNAKDMKRIFDRLYQVPMPGDPSRQGLGLGLFICKEIVVLHGGNIWVDQRPGGGSVFRFTLPIFHVSKSVEPLMVRDGMLVPKLTLLNIKVTWPPHWQAGRNREHIIEVVEATLDRCILPDLDVMLPAENFDRYTLFSIVARTDEKGAEIMESRFQNQLARCNEIQDTGIGYELVHEVVDLPEMVKDLPEEEWPAYVGSYLENQIVKFKKGFEGDEHEEDTTS